MRTRTLSERWLATGLLLVALATYATVHLLAGRYSIATFGGVAWRLDTLTGKVSRCRASGFGEGAECGTWRPQAPSDEGTESKSASYIDELIRQVERQRRPEPPR